jgi:hypothetical protein
MNWKNGHAALYYYIYSHAGLFKGVKLSKGLVRETNEDTVKRYKDQAKKLLKEHQGVLPGPVWLSQNGYWGLYMFHRSNLDKFDFPYLHNGQVIKPVKK